MAEQQPRAANAVHEHAIRWDVDRQLWVCSQGCGFSRLKRDGEVVPTREEAHAEASRAGTGLDFADLERPAVRGPGQPTDEEATQPAEVETGADVVNPVRPRFGGPLEEEA